MVQTHFFVFIDPKSVVGACLNSDFQKSGFLTENSPICHYVRLRFIVRWGAILQFIIHLWKSAFAIGLQYCCGIFASK